MDRVYASQDGIIESTNCGYRDIGDFPATNHSDAALLAVLNEFPKDRVVGANGFAVRVDRIATQEEARADHADEEHNAENKRHDGELDLLGPGGERVTHRQPPD